MWNASKTIANAPICGGCRRDLITVHDGRCTHCNTLYQQDGFSARVVSVIESEIELRGSGTEGDPYRRIRQYFSLDGRLLAEVDPWLPDPPSSASGEK